MSKRLTESKKAPERAWLNDVSSVVLQQAAADANTAHRNWLSSLSGRRRGRRVGAPRFRSKRDNRQAIRFTKNARFSVTSGGKLRLPKIGDVPVRWSRELPSDPSSVTVIVDPAGRYFASFVVDTGDTAPLPPVDAEVGIDLGLTSFAVLSNGKVIENPRYLRKAERGLKRAQQALSRKLSTTIIRENQAMYVEDLAVKGLARTKLAKSVHDAGWGIFLTLLEEKAARCGRTFARVDRWFPSSQLCSACGVKDGPKPLSVREWTCPECGTVHDRDLNAARNILLEGRKTAAGRAASACGGNVRPGSGPADPGEAGTHRSAA